VTLLELLIVMAIMVMVTAAAIPIMIPAVQNRRMREASRLASSYISGARSRAIETGRPVGVMAERFNGGNFAMVLSYVEVPRPYAGDFSGSKIMVSSSGSVTAFTLTDTLWTNVIRCGDTIKLGFKGKTYFLSDAPTLATPGKPISVAPSTTPWQLISRDGSPVVLPTTYAAGVPFQIIRQPVRSSAAPMQLPEGVVVDLLCSGMGITPLSTFTAGPTYTDVTFNPVVIFSPNGSVDYVTTPTGFTRATAPIFFLLGRRDLMPDVSKSQYDENLWDPGTTTPALNLYLSNFWIAIGNQTGTVTVAENATSGGATDVAGARAFVVQHQGVSGQ